MYHLVLVTKYRRRVLTGATVDRARAILRALCLAWEGSLLECSGEADHLHALFELPPKARPSDVVREYRAAISCTLARGAHLVKP